MPLPNIIGKKIRDLRKKKKMTLVQLAGICQCSPSLLSQIETGVINPSLNTIHAISDAFNVPLVEIVAEVGTANHSPAENVYSLVLDADKRKVITLKSGGVHFELLSQGLPVPFEFVLCEYPPGAASGDDFKAHKGEECGYVIQGELDVDINDQVFHLKTGQTITLLSTVPHRLINRSKRKTTAIWVNSTPFLFSVN